MPNGLAELDIVADPGADVLDERQSLVKGLFDLVVLRLLLLLFVDGGERVAHRAGRPPLVLRLLSLEVEDVLARADAERVAHHVNHGEAVQRSLRHAVDRIDDRRPPNLQLLALERLQVAVPAESDQHG